MIINQCNLKLNIRESFSLKGKRSIIAELYSSVDFGLVGFMPRNGAREQLLFILILEKCYKASNIDIYHTTRISWKRIYH